MQLRVKLCFVFVCALFVLQVAAQPRQLYRFPNRASDSASIRFLKRGDTVIVQSNEAMITNDKGIADMLRQDSTLSLLQAKIALLNAASKIQDSILARYMRVDSIQSQSFQKLLVAYNKADSLIIESNDNTRRAVGQSYVSAVLLGGVSGGLVVGSAGDARLGFNFWGALVGGAVGAFVNWLVFKLP